MNIRLWLHSAEEPKLLAFNTTDMLACDMYLGAFIALNTHLLLKGLYLVRVSCSRRWPRRLAIGLISRHQDDRLFSHRNLRFLEGYLHFEVLHQEGRNV